MICRNENGSQQAGRVRSVCKSIRTGTVKKPVNEAVLVENYGIRGDAHADRNSHRQVSLLARESIEKMRRKGFSVYDGDFAENITTSGIHLISMPLGTFLKIGSHILLEITQHGKTCHSPCAIYRLAGTCVMPTEGVFARVIKGGTIKPGDYLTVFDKEKETSRT